MILFRPKSRSAEDVPVSLGLDKKYLLLDEIVLFRLEQGEIKERDFWVKFFLKLQGDQGGWKGKKIEIGHLLAIFLKNFCLLILVNQF